MSKNAGTEMYIELLKKNILFEIWQEHEQDIITQRYADPEKIRMGEIWPRIAHSMIGRMRMDNIHNCMDIILQENIKGDFIETGVWRGGACIFMRGFLKAHAINDRNVWVADSFQGLPAPNIIKYPQDNGDQLYKVDYLRVSLPEVQQNFQRYGLLDENVKFLKGWFRDTLPVAPIDKLAILRLDGDMYESTMDSLTNLYHKVSKGGFIIIDDYALPGCQAAVTDFRRVRKIEEPLIKIDNFGVYWRKMSS
ncbi:TylF/MycF family methyltransferase [Bacillus benzoevorans]|uniref:Macrocin O-methyltransferase n=1 Tax=Bacillus benzoevorans TaxID=1456 RepID=A0A7X0LV68_9BACI|nr:TylF/MycF family methyltransferase [Bacillus benzoevorans]MBB6445210.1 hypothetical protein [Bacillus benzoevorans]